MAALFSSGFSGGRMRLPLKENIRSAPHSVKVFHKKDFSLAISSKPQIPVRINKQITLISCCSSSDPCSFPQNPSALRSDLGLDISFHAPSDITAAQPVGTDVAAKSSTNTSAEGSAVAVVWFPTKLIHKLASMIGVKLNPSDGAVTKQQSTASTASDVEVKQQFTASDGEVKQLSSASDATVTKQESTTTEAKDGKLNISYLALGISFALHLLMTVIITALAPILYIVGASLLVLSLFMIVKVYTYLVREVVGVKGEMPTVYAIGTHLYLVFGLLLIFLVLPTLPVFLPKEIIERYFPYFTEHLQSIFTVEIVKYMGLCSLSYMLHVIGSVATTIPGEIGDYLLKDKHIVKITFYNKIVGILGVELVTTGAPMMLWIKDKDIKPMPWYPYKLPIELNVSGDDIGLIGAQVNQLLKDNAEVTNEKFYLVKCLSEKKHQFEISFDVPTKKYQEVERIGGCRYTDIVGLVETMQLRKKSAFDISVKLRFLDFPIGLIKPFVDEVGIFLSNRKEVSKWNFRVLPVDLRITVFSLDLNVGKPADLNVEKCADLNVEKRDLIAKKTTTADLSVVAELPVVEGRILTEIYEILYKLRGF